MVYSLKDEMRQTKEYIKWFEWLKDKAAQARILVRAERLKLGYPGDVKHLGGGLYELRIFYGPGYRLYYCRVKSALILLLLGGDKSTQESDIVLARKILQRETGNEQSNDHRGI